MNGRERRVADFGARVAWPAGISTLPVYVGSQVWHLLKNKTHGETVEIAGYIYERVDQ